MLHKERGKIFVARTMRIFVFRYFHRREEEFERVSWFKYKTGIIPTEYKRESADVKRKGCKTEVVRETFINSPRRVQSVLISCRMQKNYSDRLLKNCIIHAILTDGINVQHCFRFNYWSSSYLCIIAQILDISPGGD